MKQIDMAQMPRKELEKFAMEASGEAERLRAVVEAKEAELRLLRKEKFAGKSEKSRNDNVDEAQLSFFNDAEALARPDAEELKLEKVKPLVLFKYAASRNGDVAKKALENYKGIVQCDGYDGYNKVNGIIRTGCFAHVRRKFHEALKAVDPKLPKEASASEREALKRCNRLFELDRKAKEQPVEKRLQWKEAFVREDMEDFSGGCKKREKILRWKANCS